MAVKVEIWHLFAKYYLYCCSQCVRSIGMGWGDSNLFYIGKLEMIRKLLNLIFKRNKDKILIDKAILDAVVNIAKRDNTNILFFFSIDSYNNDQHYQSSREVLNNYIRENMQGYSQRVDGCDTGSGSVLNNIENDFRVVSNKTESYDRLILSVFTKNRAELNNLASKCLSLEGVSVYIL